MLEISMSGAANKIRHKRLVLMNLTDQKRGGIQTCSLQIRSPKLDFISVFG